MKLGQLKQAVRIMDGNPQVFVTLGGGIKFMVTVQKKSLLESLDRAFAHGHKNCETGLAFDDAGRLMLDSMIAPEPEDIQIEDELEIDDLGDL